MQERNGGLFNISYDVAVFIVSVSVANYGLCHVYNQKKHPDVNNVWHFGCEWAPPSENMIVFEKHRRQNETKWAKMSQNEPNKASGQLPGSSRCKFNQTHYYSLTLTS